MCYNTPPIDQTLFHDSGVTRAVGTLPQALAAPNQYYIPGDSSLSTFSEGSRLLGTTSDTSITIVAIPWNNSWGNQVNIWVNGVSQSQVFNGMLGVPEARTIALAGGAKTIEIEEASCTICRVFGNFVWTPVYAPKWRVICVGDSITGGTGATAVNTAWTYLMRHSLTSGTTGYGVSILGYSGVQMVGTKPPASTIAARCDATFRNIVVVSYQVNDFLNGAAQAANLTAQNTYVSAIAAACPAGTKIILNTMPQTALAGGGGATAAQLRANMAGAVGGNVSYIDNSALYPSVSPYTAHTADGVHPTDAGHALMMAAVKAQVLAVS